MRRSKVALWFVLFAVTTLPSIDPAAAQSIAAANGPQLHLPLKSGSLRFAIIGDSGTGDRDQLQVAQVMERYHDQVKYDFVVMLGDNIYGGHKPSDFEQKFERPYKPLLDQGVKFYASLGNHDDPDVERNYKPFNMGGQRYYTFNKGPVEFFVLDSNYVDPAQLAWLDKALGDSKAKWKIAFFHHPLYNDGKSHGADVDLRTQVGPMFKKYGVNLVLSGHEHVYERFKPIDGIYYFVVGNSAKLMDHDIHPSGQSASSFDTDKGFMLMEIDGDSAWFQVVSRTGSTIDSGEFGKQSAPKTQ